MGESSGNGGDEREVGKGDWRLASVEHPKGREEEERTEGSEGAALGRWAVSLQSAYTEESERSTIRGLWLSAHYSVFPFFEQRLRASFRPLFRSVG